MCFSQSDKNIPNRFLLTKWVHQNDNVKFFGIPCRLNSAKCVSRQKTGYTVHVTDNLMDTILLISLKRFLTKYYKKKIMQILFFSSFIGKTQNTTNADNLIQVKFNLIFNWNMLLYRLLKTVQVLSRTFNIDYSDFLFTPSLSCCPSIQSYKYNIWA